MLNSIHIQGFKGFKDTKIEGLRKVNLILGGQNVGKTSLLEAVYLGVHPKGEVNMVSDIFRSFEKSDSARYYEYLYREGEINIIIDVESEINNKKLVSRTTTDRSNLKGKYPYVEDLNFSHSFNMARGVVSDELHQYAYEENVLTISINQNSQESQVQLIGKVIGARKKKNLIKILSEIEKRIEDVEVISPDGDLRVYIGLKNELTLFPLTLLGHGFSRLLNLYSNLIVTYASLVLIDEIENGIHYTALPVMFKGIKEITEKDDIQSIITTHSWECIRAACEVYEDKPEDFQCIRLERDGDNIKAVCIPGEQMLQMMNEDMEVR